MGILDRFFRLAAALAICLLEVGVCEDGDKFYSEAENAYQAKEYEKAAKLFTEAAKYSPKNPAVYGNRGSCYSYLGKLDEALRDYEKAIKLGIELSGNPNHPNLAYFYYNRGYAYERAKVFDKAIQDYEKTISLNEKYPEVRNNLAWILSTCSNAKLRNPKRAIAVAEAECSRTEWKEGGVLDTLAAAYAAAGNFRKAIEFELKAMDFTSDEAAKTRCQERLELYRQKKPYVQSDQAINQSE